MRKTIAGMIQQAIDAQPCYQVARDAGQPAEEVERLRLQAESLYQAVTEYQLRALGGESATRH
ncbi:hypothetical protein [Pseudomonas rubra]|uniref:Uncharacterized protein n=1 Tax=Pseudomonas rubra TaxID=2942627 RepID=A0ABT5PFY0_9PSED|nr:hypothetical protein [Pseudomonas rubra]MDD1016908.1 hypothetical protein [Pseudomonas rubra]MDD1039346.1 hypothetical protein [Pseudomonas rubra]MDD1157872.1 hypothetical protein [Pseudomonas rubra]